MPIHTFDVRDNPINGNLALEKPLLMAHYNVSNKSPKDNTNEEVITNSEKNDIIETNNLAANADEEHHSEPKKMKLDS